MKILVSNLRLNHFGGSEIWTYQVVEELLRLNHEVYIYTREVGEVYDMLIQKGAKPFHNGKQYDLGILNHVECIHSLRDMDISVRVQTCHGVFPAPEQPVKEGIDYHVSITEEVHDHLLQKGIKSDVLYNPVNLDRYDRMFSVSDRVNSILCLCVGTQAQQEVIEVGKRMKIRVSVHSKWKEPIFNLEEEINKHDLVIGYGRGVVESIACGRNVIVYDSRRYTPKQGDGLLTKDNFNQSLACNFTGRATNKKFTVKSLCDEVSKATYQKSEWIYLQRNLFNVRNIVKKYLSYVK